MLRQTGNQVRAPQLHETSNPFLDTPTLSMLEKYLLRRGWRLENFTAPHDGRFMTRAIHPEGREWVSYPHPHYHYHGQDRQADLHGALEDLARGLRRLGRESTVESLSLELGASLTASSPDFACRQCGDCCQGMADAYQGRVSVEEVEVWRAQDLGKILRFVQVVQRSEYTLYKTWVHPVTGRYLPRCPWLSRPVDGRRLCRIHAFRPLKCRSFPLSSRHAADFGCPGLQTHSLELDGEPV